MPNLEISIIRTLIGDNTHSPLSGENDSKNSEDDLLGPVMGSIRQAMDFEETELGRKLMAKAPAPADGEATEQGTESELGDWELIGDDPATPNLSEGSAFENVPEPGRTIEVSFNDEGEERDKQGRLAFLTFSDSREYSYFLIYVLIDKVVDFPTSSRLSQPQQRR